MLSLHNLKKSKGTRKKRERLGRGNATGSGNYSTRGMKGQRARSGGKSGLALRSIKSYLLGVPKTRGFKSLNKSRAVVNVGDLDKNFSSGQTINARDMLKKGLITSIVDGVKVLSEGKLNKNLIVQVDAYSAGAKQKIEAAGGKALIISSSEKDEESKKDVDESDKKTLSKDEALEIKKNK